MTEPDYSNIAAHHRRCLAWFSAGLEYKDDENAGGCCTKVQIQTNRSTKKCTKYKYYRCIVIRIEFDWKTACNFNFDAINKRDYTITLKYMAIVK